MKVYVRFAREFALLSAEPTAQKMRTRILFRVSFPRFQALRFFSLQIDEDLSFLNGIVSEALAAGAKPYSKPSEDGDSAGASSFRRDDGYDM